MSVSFKPNWRWTATRFGIKATACVLCASLVLLCAQTQASPKPFTKDEVVKLLTGNVPVKRVEQLVRERGIDFQITSETGSELRMAGATDQLISSMVFLGPPILSVTSLKGALVFVDDTSIGTTPEEGELIISTLTVGAHRLHLSLKGYREYRESVDLRRGFTTRVFAILVPDLPLLLENAHPGGVLAVAFSPDGKRLATAGQDSTAKVWDSDSGMELLSLRGHSGPVFSVAFSPDGKRLASVSYDKTAKIWEGGSGRNLLSFAQSSWFSRVVFSPDGKHLAIGGNHGTVLILDSDSGKELLSLRGHTSTIFGVLAYSPDGKRLVTATDDDTATVWDAFSGRRLLMLHGHNGIVDVTFSPDGKQVAIAGYDSTARIWDSTSGQKLLTLRGHADYVSAVAFSPDGKRLATGSKDGTAKVWDLASGQELQTLRGALGYVTDIAFSPDGKRLAAAGADGDVEIFIVDSK